MRNFTARECKIAQKMAKSNDMPLYKVFGGKRYMLFSDGWPKDIAVNIKNKQAKGIGLNARIVAAQGKYFVYAR